MFPAYLRAAGYYTTNNSKEDYNATKSDDVWNDSSKKASWTKRPGENTPFFHVLTTNRSHESRLHFNEQSMQTPTETDAGEIKLQPYFPDTKTFRYTRAKYHDLMKANDDMVGEVINQLREAGQLENTFVFYFGDHGGVLPRSKGYLYESGLHVPLVVRIPKNFETLVDRKRGTRTDGFVEFVDFGPTVLQLAGVDLPKKIDGEPFLGPGIDAAEVDSRDRAFGYADRFDEKYDLVRSLRVGRYKYIRNFEPFYPDGIQNNYRYKMLAYQQWRDLHDAGKLNDVQSQFFEPKPAEALFDLEDDPHETKNLASVPVHQDTLARMRSELTNSLKSMPDLSFVSEAILYESAMDDPVSFGKSHQPEIESLISTADLSLLPWDAAKTKLEEAIQSKDAMQRYWGIVAATCFGEEATPLTTLIRKRLVDTEPMVVMRAVEFIALTTNEDPRDYLYRSFQRATNIPEGLRMLGTAVFLNDYFGDRLMIDPAKVSFGFKTDREIENRLKYLSHGIQ